MAFRIGSPLLALAALFTLSTSAVADTHYHVAGSQPLPGGVRWDYLSFDPAEHRLFVTRGDHVDVLDVASKRLVGSITDLSGVHGVALVPEFNRGFISNGKSDTVTVFELSTLKVVGSVATDHKPDAMVYDPATKHIFVANNGSGTFTVIDAATSQSLGRVEVGGALEFAVVDDKGLLFVNVEDRNQLVTVDTRKMTVLDRENLGPVCEGPAGLAIDRRQGRLFSSCDNRKLMVVDAYRHRVITVLPIGKGSDAAAFDAELGLVFSSNGEGNLTVIGQDDQGHYHVEQSLLTQPSARTMALDPLTHAIYLVAAEEDHSPLPAGQPAPKHRFKPDSFSVITVWP